ncbi:MAG: glycosyltransferase [Sandaracinaceae bacterium]|nr:glycosyltransferase [Sandaracinaceae bacterium]
MRLAYLVTEYPAVSHTFIRREIRALESLGVQVFRYSVRRQRGALVDPDDVEESRRTRVILDEPLWAFLRASERLSLREPLRFARALGAASRLGFRSDRGLLYHAAYFLEACLLCEWMREERIEHLHAHFGTNSAMVALLAHLLGGPSFSFTVHGPDEFDRPIGLKLGEKIAHASFVVAISNFGKSQLLRWARPEDWGKVRVIRCGLEPEDLERPPTPVPEVPRFVSVGRLAPQKGQLLLVEAIGILHKEGVEVELVLVGEGEMRKKLEEAIKRWGLEGRVHLLGALPGSGVRQAIIGSRAFVLSSFAEGLPVVLMEAMALGRPVIATFVGGIPELVAPGRSGWLVPAGSASALASAMKEALTTPAPILSIMGLAGREAVLANHDVRRTAQSLLYSFEEAIRSSKSG